MIHLSRIRKSYKKGLVGGGGGSVVLSGRLENGFLAAGGWRRGGEKGSNGSFKFFLIGEFEGAHGSMK